MALDFDAFAITLLLAPFFVAVLRASRRQVET